MQGKFSATFLLNLTLAALKTRMKKKIVIKETAESKRDTDRAVMQKHLYTRRRCQLQERWLARQVKQNVYHPQVGKVAHRL